MDVSQLKEQVDSLIKMGNYEEIQPVLMQNKKITGDTNQLDQSPALHRPPQKAGSKARQAP